jgi:glycosyltransferase involved in cell wall biosynthesis
MTAPRVLIVAQKFWPVVDDNSAALLSWAGALARRGCQMTVVTPRWHSSWPAKSECREVKIHRLLPAPTSSWYSTHYVRNLARWLTQNLSNWDCIFVDQPGPELFQICNRRVCGDLPVYGRIAIDPAPLQPSLPQMAIDAARKLNAVVVPDAQTHRALSAAGVIPSKIVRIADASLSPIHRQEKTKFAARSALAKVSNDFNLPFDTKLIVSVGEISHASGAELLSNAAMSLLEQGKRIRVWMAGPEREARFLYSKLRDRSWHADIMLFGVFDDVDELVAAADLFVLPNLHGRARFLLPHVVASGVPWIAPTNDEWRTRLGNLSNQFFWNGDLNGMVGKLDEWLLKPREFETTAGQLAESFLRANPAELILDDWIGLFSRT